MRKTPRLRSAGLFLPEIKKLHQDFYKDEFPLPSRKRRISEAAVVDQEQNLIGYGVVKALAEAVMFLDKTQSTRTKSEALMSLLLEAIKTTRSQGVEQLHIFTADPKFSTLMQKHFGFKKVQGEVLVMNLEE